MYERSTDSRQSTKRPKVHPAAEAPYSQGMGTYRQRCGNSPEVPASSDDPVSVAQSTGARGRNVSERQASPKGGMHQGARGREPEIERSPCLPNPGTDAVKKKDELGLTNRRKGTSYSGTQRVRIVARVKELKAPRGLTKPGLSRPLACAAPVITDGEGTTTISRESPRSSV